MIQVRKSLFETNSSSTNTFIIPKDESCKFISQIKYNRYSTDLDTIEGRVNAFYDTAKYYGLEQEFIAYLLSRGVELVFDKPSVDPDHLARIYKLDSLKELDQLLFCESTKEYTDRDRKKFDSTHYKMVPVALVDD